ncbi:MAG TPA: M1 family metallopeptidase [Firmicutes bacterium]|nr:hypothetical protein [Bacillota bacterium]HHY98489.1 M1 family metallopeptidase [Bacillota bacterium]
MRVGHYDLDASVEFPPVGLSPYAPGQLEVSARLHIRNVNSEPCSAITLFLYRLFNVYAVTVDECEVGFEQKITTVKGLERWHVNTVTISLPKSLKPGKECCVSLKYRGLAAGAREVWPYIYDTVSRDYTLLRPDLLWYPVTDIFEQPMNEFTYALTVEVPTGYVAVAPGDCEKDGNFYHFRCNEPRWRLDLAIAQFDRTTLGNLTIYYLPGFEDWSKCAQTWVARTLEGMARRMGERIIKKLDIVQIPEWWGSQSSPGFILQEARDENQWSTAAKVIHEVCHFWTIEPSDWPNRFADESLAHYFQVVILDDIFGREIAKENLDQYRQSLEKTPAVRKIGLLQGLDLGQVPMLGTLNRCKGPLALDNLRSRLGEGPFWQLMTEYVHQETGSVKDFVDLLRRRHPGSDTEEYLDRWYR